MGEDRPVDAAGPLLVEGRFLPSQTQEVAVQVPKGPLATETLTGAVKPPAPSPKRIETLFESWLAMAF